MHTHHLTKKNINLILINHFPIMRKSLLLLLVALICPVVALAQNKALTKTHTAYGDNTNGRQENHIIVPYKAAVGHDMPAQASDSYTFGMWFKMSSYYTTTSTSATKRTVLARLAEPAHLNLNGNWCMGVDDAGNIIFSGHNGYTESTGIHQGGAQTPGVFSEAGGAATTINAGIQTNTWYHILFAVDNANNRLALYLNGALLKEWTTTVPLYYGGTEGETKGGWDNGEFSIADYGFSGLVDEVQFWNRGLTDAEAASAYINTTSVLNGLSALYLFNDPTSPMTNVAPAAQAGTDAGYYHYTCGRWFQDGLYGINSSWNTEYNNTLLSSFDQADGREILELDDILVMLEQTEGGTLTLSNGTESWSSDDEIEVVGGTTFTFNAEAEAGYALVGIYALLEDNSMVEIPNGGTYTFYQSAMVSATFSDALHTLTIQKDDDVTVTIEQGGVEITDLSALIDDTDYNVTIAVPETKTLEAVKLDGTELTANNGVYTINLTADATLEVVTPAKPTYTVTFQNGSMGRVNATYTNKAGETVTINSGDQLIENTVISLTNTPAEGYVFLKYRVNGTAISNSTLTLTQDVTISADFEEAPELNPSLTFKSATAINNEDRFHVLLDVVGASSTSGGSAIVSKSIAVGAWIRMTAHNSAGLSSNYNGNDIFTYGMLNHMNQNGLFSLYTNSKGNPVIGGLGIERGTECLKLGSVQTISNVTIPLNEWHYVAVSVDFDNKNLDFFYDGELAKRIPFTGTAFVALGDSPLGFGFGGNKYYGAMDDVHILNRAMTEEDAQNIYYENAGAVQGMAAWFTFDEVMTGTTNTFENKVPGATVNGTYDNVFAAVSTSYSGKTAGTPDLTTINMSTQRIPVKSNLDEPRTVTVLSANDELGTVAITSPATEGNSVTTDEKVVTMKATAAATAAFMNWTNEDGEVVSTDATYTYAGAADATFTANFGHTVSYTVGTGGTASFRVNNASFISGSIFAPDTQVDILTQPTGEMVVKAVKVNGEPIEATAENTYNFTLNTNSEIEVSFMKQEFTLTIISSGKGAVEVWSEAYEEDDYRPAGEQYLSGAYIPFGGDLNYYFMPEAGETIESVVVDNGGYVEEAVIDVDVVPSDYDPNVWMFYTEGIMGNVTLTVVFSDNSAAIDGIGIDPANGPVEYYNLSGVKVSADNLVPGFYILRQGDKSVKVFINK